MVRLRVPDEALRWGVLAGLAGLLATPLVVTPGTLFPFVVGKAIWSRSIIEIVFAFWAALALARPAYRPPRSWLLILLAAGLGVSLLAAGFGVSFQHSVWSEYERMQGVVDLAHWFALALVLTSMFRTPAAWRALLRVNLGVGAALACLALARYFEWDVPFYSLLPEREFPRIGGSLGNPTYLSVYMLLNTVVALGFLARSVVPAAPPSRPRERRRNSSRGRRSRPASPWMGRLGWAALAALHLGGLGLAGSVGGFVGLLASVCFLAAACAFLGRGRLRQAAVAVIVVLGTATLLVGIRVVDPDRAVALRLDSPLLQHVARVHIQRPSIQSRLAAWEAGVRGFADRPLLGWGPGNFESVFGRFASGYATTSEPHDQAHSKLVEVAATTGVLGLAQYLAIWSLTFLVVLRAAGRMESRDRWFALFIGAALLGYLAQGQFLFDATIISLQYTLLLGFVVSLEATAFSDARRPRLPVRLSAAWAGLLRHNGARAAVAVVAIALVVTGLRTHRAIYAAADNQHVAARPVGSTGIEEAINGFKPMANLHRWLLFQDFTQRWPRLRAERGAGARSVLEWVDAEAAEAIRTEPENWRLQHSLARMYRVVAQTEPQYEALARRHLERARALAPNRAIFPVDLVPPQPLEIRQRDDGSRELRWQRAVGAGYHQVGEWLGDDDWRTLRYLYDPGVTSFVLPGPNGREAGTTTTYGVKACAHPRKCSDWIPWPLITLPRPGRRATGAADDPEPAAHAPASGYEDPNELRHDLALR